MHVRTELAKFEERWEPVTESGCWVWIGAVWANGRYGCFRGKESAHKASLRLYKDQLTSSREHVCHKCDNTLCVNPDHLFVSDMSGNMRDQVKKGRKIVALQKLGKAEVEACIAGRKAGRTVRSLAAQYGVSESQMSRITRGFRTYYNPVK